MKPDERRLLAAVARGISPRIAFTTCRIPPKRGRYILTKWDRRGWYEWGVNIERGWLTPEGIEAAKEHT